MKMSGVKNSVLTPGMFGILFIYLGLPASVSSLDLGEFRNTYMILIFLKVTYYYIGQEMGLYDKKPLT